VTLKYFIEMVVNQRAIMVVARSSNRVTAPIWLPKKNALHKSI